MTFDDFRSVITVIAVLGVVAAVIYGSYRRKNFSVNLSNTPVLLSHYTAGGTLVPVKEGKFGDMNFSAFVMVNPEIIAQGGEAGLVFRIELPFQTSVHLMGIPTKGHETQINPTQMGSLMERIDLEGEYSQYFSLFCEKGMQTEGRYVLDPKAMLFTLDFCQSQSWEIVANELYFVQTGPNQANDPTLLTDDILKFVEEIEPAVAVPLTDAQKIEMTPYGEDRRTDLKCPLCNKTLINTDECFTCPDGEGILLTGAKLSDVREGKLKLAELASKPPLRPGNLHCPSCGNEMSHVAYDGSKVMIDSCSHCTYRWLDAGEFAEFSRI